MRQWWPGIGNVIKFGLAQIVVLFGIFHPFKNAGTLGPISALHQVWIALFITASFMLWFWDVTMDWGLGRPQYKFLADRQMYSRKWIYYCKL